MNKDYVESFREQWAEVYVNNTIPMDKRDAHTEFADLCGIDRQEAKEICYRLLYMTPITRYLIKSHQEYLRDLKKQHK